MNSMNICVSSVSAMLLVGVMGCGENPPAEPQAGAADTSVRTPLEQDQLADATDTPARLGLPETAQQVAESEQMNPEFADILAQYIEDGIETTPMALATLEPSEGYDTAGTVAFIETDTGAGIRIIARIRNVTDGSHGFHVHENGDCSAADASSAGDHLNPGDQPHGGRGSDQRHVGDLGNIVADGNGMAMLDIQDDVISLEGPNSIIGKAVVVHSEQDDLNSQPSGNAGERVACGVIEMHEVTAERDGFSEQ